MPVARKEWAEKASGQTCLFKAEDVATAHFLQETMAKARLSILLMW
jgi:hypothetical protein